MINLNRDLSELLEQLCDRDEQVAASQEGSDVSFLASTTEIRYRFEEIFFFFSTFVH